MQTIVVQDGHEQIAEDGAGDEDQAVMLAASEDERFQTVRAFMKKPKVSLEYVRSLPASKRQEPELPRTAGSFDTTAVKQKIEIATSSACRTWGREGGYLRADRRRGASGYQSQQKSLLRTTGPGS